MLNRGSLCFAQLLFFFLVCMVAATQVLTVVAQSAGELSSSEYPSAPADVVQLPLTVDCSRWGEFTTEGQAIAIANGYCQADGTSPITPYEYYEGNCGTSSFSILPTSISGNAYVYMSLSTYSALGAPIAELYWYYQLYYGESGFFEYSGSAFPWRPFWSRSAVVDIDPGYVWGFLGGSAYLANGTFCVIGYPSDDAWV
jgi:hypothetical protein